MLQPEGHRSAEYKDLDPPGPFATDGEIAAINLESARRSAWARFEQNAHAPGIAEALVSMERSKAQFFGDFEALDRMEDLASRFAYAENSFRAALVGAEVAATVHRFDDSREYVSRAARMGAPRDDIWRHTLTLNQACGVDLDEVVVSRRRMAAASGRLEDLVPLGAVLGDLERFAEADAVYEQAFYSYADCSPFALAWVCFQCGMLWGELVAEPDATLAALWYRRAIAYVPGYVKARVHLAEIYAGQENFFDAMESLRPVLSCGDPEVRWRLAGVLTAQKRWDEAETQLEAARLGFDGLIARYPLAFADHAAEFYADSGKDPHRALELARMNVVNRPTRRATRQASAIAAQIQETSDD